MKKFKGLYRTDSIRLKKWNYGWKGAYFVTIKTRFRNHYFGEIHNGKLYLSELGRIAEKEWIRSPEIRPDMNLTLDVFQVMPDHFHAIVEIGWNEYNLKNSNTAIDSPLYFKNKNGFQNAFASPRKNLGSLIRGYKSAVTTYARMNNLAFDWQSSYYCVLIQNKNHYKGVKNYIMRNISKWKNK